MLLVDSSIWVLAEHNRIVIADHIPDGESAAVCPIIVQEVLRGTADPERYAIARQALLAAEMLDSPTPLERFEDAARIFIACRKNALTIRSAVDCLVAATALAHRATVLHNDRDFDHIARVLDLRTIRVNPS